MKHADPSDTDLVLLLEIFGPLYREHVSSLLPKGISPARLRILAALSEAGPLNMSELRHKTGGSAQNLTGLIDALEREGTVQRRTSDRDRRVVLIELTRARKDEILKDRDQHRDEVAKLFSNLSKTEKIAFKSSLSKLNQQLESGRRP
ncbi:MAG: MarR family transcriptional regulator [Pseudomonadota bacterium]